MEYWVKLIRRGIGGGRGKFIVSKVLLYPYSQTARFLDIKKVVKNFVKKLKTNIISSRFVYTEKEMDSEQRQSIIKDIFELLKEINYDNI